MDTQFEGLKITPLQRSKTKEPVLCRKALLAVLEDRASNQTLWQRKPYTCMIVNSSYNGKEYTGFGFSKVCYPDKWDAEEGAERAFRRALIMILHQVREDEHQS